jgi:hypothetical protein
MMIKASGNTNVTSAAAKGKALYAFRKTPTQTFTLFDSVPEDYLSFGQGPTFKAKEVQTFLSLNKDDISRLAEVSSKSVRFDKAMPEPMRLRLEEIALTINWVAKAMGGDVIKTAAWFKARNPLLGDISPRDMIRLGRFERLRKFIINAMMERAA